MQLFPLVVAFIYNQRIQYLFEGLFSVALYMYSSVFWFFGLFGVLL